MNSGQACKQRKISIAAVPSCSKEPVEKIEGNRNNFPAEFKVIDHVVAPVSDLFSPRDI
jgi:hypothetical protein